MDCSVIFIVRDSGFTTLNHAVTVMVIIELLSLQCVSYCVALIWVAKVQASLGCRCLHGLRDCTNAGSLVYGDRQ